MPLPMLFAALSAPPPSSPTPPFLPVVELCTADRFHQNCSLRGIDPPPCAPGNFSTCDCLVVNPTASRAAADAIEGWDAWQRRQALVQLVLSSLSLLLSVCFVLTFAAWPSRMLRYPLTLHLWKTVCDGFVSLQFVVVAATRLGYDFQPAGADQVWVLSSEPSCLCAIEPAHPGCVCNAGVLSFMLQAGLVGSVAFYLALAHNFHRSVADPFTRPSARAGRYYATCTLAVPAPGHRQSAHWFQLAPVTDSAPTACARRLT